MHHVLFAYRTSLQRIAILLVVRQRCPSANIYRSVPLIPSMWTTTNVTLSEAWQLAKNNIQETKTQQKKNYDKSSSPTKLQVDAPRETRQDMETLTALPWDPQFLSLTHPDEELIFVSLNRVHPCHSELPEISLSRDVPTNEHYLYKEPGTLYTL